MNNAERKGHEAFRQGKQLNENPFKSTPKELDSELGLTSDHTYWKNGWFKAQDEASEDWVREQIRKNK